MLSVSDVVAPKSVIDVLALVSYKVGIVDCDYQRTTHKLCLLRDIDQPHRKQPIVINLHVPKEKKLKSALLLLKGQGVDLAFIDVGGYQSGAMMDAGLYANLWIVPISPTPILNTRINRWAAIPNGTFKGLSAAEIQPGGSASKQRRELFDELLREVR